MAKIEEYKKIGLSTDDVELLSNYFTAFANFYGIIDLKTAFEIINDQNDGRFPEDVLLKFAKMKNKEKNCYTIFSPKEFYDDADDAGPLDDEIVEESLYAVDDDCYYVLAERQAGKPFYVPPKYELLKYADGMYCEENAAISEMTDFLEQKATLANPNVDEREVAEEYAFGVRIETDLGGLGLESILFYLEPPEDEQEQLEFLNELAQRATAVRNNTRMWANRGYTPTEMAALSGGIKAENIRIFNERL